jgi:glycine/D-amino acid oxidase-like deaminating enzyme
MTPKYDAIVIGAGIVGAACAYELRQAGLKVVALDAFKVGCGTTGGSMGHIVVMDDSEAQLNLTSLSRDLWKHFAEDHAAAIEYNPCGTIWIAADDEEMDTVHSKARNYEAHGIAVQVLDAQNLYALEPNLRKGLVGGLRVLDDCVIYPPYSSRLLLEQTELRENCRVSRIYPNQVQLEDGSTLQAEVIVNACGAAAPQITPELPIQPRKGHLVITDRYPDFCRHQLVELGYLKSAHKMEQESVAFNIQPRLSGQYLVGSSREFAGWNDEVNRSVLQSMLSRACSYMPKLKDLMAIRSWTGFRPATPDKLPLIGKWSKVAGLYIAAGHEGLGITSSMGTARLLTDEILGRTPAIDPAPYRATRIMENPPE